MTSIEFLQKFHPTGFWVLVAIKVNRHGIEVATFTPDQAPKAKAWITARSGKANIYFSVNQPGRPITKKALRDDIVSVEWLHVDMDARIGEPLEEALPRIRGVLDNCPVHRPTAVVFSGGGYQGFWRLAQPIPVKTTAAKLDMARYNKQLEAVLEGDNCHNIDRIMRLPGTMNIPNAKKVERGRVPAMAEVVWFEDHAYDITEFIPAPAVQMAGITHNATLAAPTSNVARLDSVDDLKKWKVPDRIKVIIVQGEHPDEVKPGDSSRSEWLFDVVCNLVRSEVPDDVIYSVITDPGFQISASVLDKKPNEDEYAMRQIQRAKEEVEEPWLRKLNEQFLVVGNLGGKCRVVEEVLDPVTGRMQLTKQTFNDFRNRFSHCYISMGKKIVTVGMWWLANPKRRHFDYLVFNPGGDTPGCYNLWQGFGCQPRPGDGHLSYLKHLRENICSGVDEHYDYLMKWLARAVQKPNTAGETAVVMRGRSGTGKSFFVNHFGMLFGRHFMQVSDAKHLVGSFNAHLRDCVVLFGDEAFYAGDKKHESVLKTLITERRMMIEHKGVDAEVSPNFTHVLLASNGDWVVPTGADERRFFVLDVGDHHQQDNAYFKAIDEELLAGGNENLLHYLMTMNLEGFEVRKVPSTKALLEQKMQSLDTFQEWWLHRLRQGTLLDTLNGYEPTVSCSDITDDYVQHVNKFNAQRIGTSTRLGIFLGSVCPGNYPRRKRETAGNRGYCYEFPTLRMLRDQWEKRYGSTLVWDDETSVVQKEVPF